ncbi:MAG: DNA repair exonuclease [Lachnospiraceae bacterium]|uniref:DNA repair exonuclease n=1 Tax=Candidatus Weimeria bifida TaxID=2599074 RepID=A0A6N7IXG6_9FIRM|nr:DNA repair exonuclease [Candidatus Weimeria bifida]RRF95187.1 MAG: DNA repair exonuclease [Lachnospiraceae bacterium]
MKIMHCADIHLDSKMESRLTCEQAAKRREEMLMTFHDSLDYAAEQGVRAVLISGDLFDKRHIRKTVKDKVEQEIVSHREMDFYYLRGNHDITDFLDEMDELPGNLHLFSKDKWTSYPLPDDNIVITGRELDAKASPDVMSELVLDQSKVNIVMLHGMDSEYPVHDNSYVIDLTKMRGRYIDYLALGHIHSYRWEKLDERGVLCYPGCMEGRGFDECGKKGFVVLDIDKDGVKSHKFISLARRELHEIKVELAPEDDLDSIISKVKDVLNYSPEKDLIRVVLTGRKNMDLEIDCDWIKDKTDRNFFYYEVRDDTKTKINYETFANDRSLKGTFVRTVQGLDMDEERKARIIEIGIRAIMEGSLIE